MKTTIIGIAGGTASGKTTIAKLLYDYVIEKDKDKVVLIRLDDYYYNRDKIPLDDEGKANYDHPDSYDLELILKNLRDLKEGKAIDKPTYDFVTHSRTNVTEHIEPAQIIILEGIMVFAIKKLRKICDIKLYVDTPDDIRFIRRLKRDMVERGRSLDSVVNQYLSSVRPMHAAFVEPSKRHADIIIPDGGQNEVAMEFLYSQLDKILKQENENK